MISYTCYALTNTFKDQTIQYYVRSYDLRDRFDIPIEEIISCYYDEFTFDLSEVLTAHR